MTDELMTTTRARDEYGISTERMKKLLADGVIPFVLSPLDKRVKLISRADMERWVQSVAGIPKPTRRKPTRAPSS